MTNILDSFSKPFLVLAPMDDVTDTVFRQIVKGCSPADLSFTEFVNVDGLQSPGRSKLIKKLKISSNDGPVVAQLWGKNPDNFYKTAQQIADGTFAKEMGLPESLNFAGVDLNMGCPQKSEVNNGTCSALINDRSLAKEIIEATQSGLNGQLPMSVKTRLGFNEVDLTWHEFLLGFKLNMLTIHGRTKKQMSKVPANWELIGEIKKLRDSLAPGTFLVGNGDVMSHKQAMELTKKYELDGIMIGRGILHDPFVFSEEDIWQNYSKEQKIHLYKKHVELFNETWTNGERVIQTLNKFCKVYINEFDGAKELREKLMLASNPSDIIGLLNLS